jgi:hypothetical protein
VNRARTQRIKINRSSRPIRDTGGPDTSLGNSCNIAHAAVYAIAHYPTVKEAFAYLGFDMKLKIFNDIKYATFLKGMWYPVEDNEFNYYWGPLPSRLLKIGKTLRDPRVLYQDKNFYSASLKFLNDIACCYSYFLQVPLLKQFVDNYRFCPQVYDFYEKHKIQAARCRKPMIAFDAYLVIAQRYGVSESDLFDFESTYPRNTCVFHGHPLYYRMAKVDYS